MSVRALAAPLGGALAVAAGVWAVARLAAPVEPIAPSSPPPVAAALDAPTPGAAVASAVVEPAAATPAVDRSRDLALPDGTFVPALNDAVDAAPLAQFWGPFPWSPIVGVERSSANLDWYKHADGSYSTTQMVWRQDLGRHAAMTRVAHPGPSPAATAPLRQ